MNPPLVYFYDAVIEKVVDADTVDIVVDLGFRIKARIRTRLLGINAPEVSTSEGKVARDYLRGMLLCGMSVRVQTFADPKDKYGRWLATIWLEDLHINQHLVSKGMAVPYAT